MRKIGVILGVALALSACGSDEPDEMSRDQAIQQIRNELPVDRDEAGDLIDNICATFADGWGGAIIDQRADVPYDKREALAHVIILAARSECPQNIVDAERWQEYNGWG